MEKVVKRFSEDKIRERVQALADLISKDFRKDNIMLLGILKGAFMFQADLMRLMGKDCQFDFIQEKMEQGTISFSGEMDITDKNVILLKDVCHTGIVEHYLMNQLRSMNPTSVRLACLIDKPMERKIDVSVDYALFMAEEGIFVGYGLEYKGYHGHLPFIATVEK